MNDAGSTDLELAIEAVAVEYANEFAFHVTLRTTRGDLPGMLNACEGGTAAVICVGGAMGGIDGPGDRVYATLAGELVVDGITTLRLDYRSPGEFDECVLDVLAGLSFLRGIGAERVALLGHSFGGAVVIKSAELSTGAVAVAALSSQLFGTQGVAQLAPRPLLLVHGTDDTVLEATASQILYDRAREPRELVLLAGAGHGLQECGTQLYSLLHSWLLRVLPEPD